MAITVTSDLTTLTTADTTTAGGTWARVNGTTSGNPAAEADGRVQGAGSLVAKCGATTTPTDVGLSCVLTGANDVTGKHLFSWRMNTTSANMSTKANQGVAFHLSSDATFNTTNYKRFFLDGSDTDVVGGWKCYVVDPSLAGDVSAGSFNIAALRTLGFIHRQLSGVTTSLNNAYVDAVRAGTGLTATASSAGDTITFATLYGQDSLNANAWGIITSSAGVYYGAGKMTIGATGQVNTCLFKDANAVLVWRDYPVANTLYEFSLLGAVGNLTTFQLGDKDGSNNTSNGCVVRGQGAAVWNITCGANTAFKAYSSSLAGVRAATLSSASELRNTSVSGSGTFDVNGATVVGCSFASHTATQLKVDATSEMSAISATSFTSGGTGHAIELTVAGTYTFSGIKFAGYGADGTTNAAVYNNSGGAVTINVTGGGSTPTVRNGASASTTVNSNVQVTLTGLKNPSEVRVFSAGTTTEVGGTGAESVTTGTHVFSLASGQSVDIAILALGYQNMRILAYSTTADASLPISQVLDRQYLNP